MNKISLMLKGVGALLCAVMLTSCTVDEPKGPSGSASSMRLKSLTMAGVPLVTYEYDNYNRVTGISLSKDAKWTLTYEGISKVPVKIEEKDYDYFWDYEQQAEVRKLDSYDIWYDIQSDSHGRITSMKNHGEQYTYNYSYELESDQVSTYEYDCSILLKYDVSGHLLQEESIDDNGYVSVYNYNWEGDLLTSVIEPGNNPENIYIQYSDVSNQHLQWDPLNQMFGPIAITGIYGKAPAKFMKKWTKTQNGSVVEENEMAYLLLDNGLIKATRNSDMDIQVIINFNYENAK